MWCVKNERGKGRGGGREDRESNYMYIRDTSARLTG